jgi:hypothetical protein
MARPRPDPGPPKIEVPVEAYARAVYLHKKLKTLTPDELIVRALRFYDVVVSSVVVEGAECRLHHRNGREEKIEL